jgi:UDP-3-O-[3-hydroxymyristoyl] glucosamine N-acyltransferase
MIQWFVRTNKVKNQQHAIQTKFMACAYTWANQAIGLHKEWLVSQNKQLHFLKIKQYAHKKGYKAGSSVLEKAFINSKADFSKNPITPIWCRYRQKRNVSILRK